MIRKSNSIWVPHCVYSSPSTGDLLVVMCMFDTDSDTYIGKVMRYNKNGLNPQSVLHNSTPQDIFRDPSYIIENNNGDVVVSESRAVVVTSQEGFHRFSYQLPSTSTPRILACGICTDALSHILVCDFTVCKIHLLNQDGHFLKFLLTHQSPGMDYSFPVRLSYNAHSHCLWVGSGSMEHGLMFPDRKLSVYRHINRHPAIQGKHDRFICLIHLRGNVPSLYLIALDG